MKSTFYLITFLFFISAQSQSALSSKKTSGEIQIKDTNYINQLIEENQYLIYRSFINPDSVFLIYQKIVELSEELGFIEGKAEGLMLIGDYYKNINNDFQAVQYYDRSIEFYDQKGNNKQISVLQNYIGHIYRGLGDKEKAVEYFTWSKANATAAKDSSGISTAIWSMGILYLEDEATFNRGIEKFLESIDILEAIEDTVGLGISYLGVGQSYLEKDKPEQALPFLKKAMELGNDNEFPTLYNEIGNAYLKMNQYQSAKEFYQKVLDLAWDAFTERVNANIGLGNIELELKNYSRAITHFNNAVLKSDEIAEGGQIPIKWLLNDRKEALQGLVEGHNKRNDYRNAFLAQQKLDDVQESILSDANNQKEELSKQLQALYKNDFENQSREFEIQREIDQQAKVLLYIGLGVLVLIALGLTYQFLFIRKTNKKITEEKDRSENLLLNILPAEIAEELKLKGSAEARDFDLVSVLFTDFEGFTRKSAKLSANELIGELNNCFRAFDQICEKYSIEKIKTIGDAYMAAGGLPIPSDESVKNTVLAALEMQSFINNRILQKHAKKEIGFEMRVGIHTGPVVAGIVGVKKFQYDIWGDTVNTASRIQSSGEIGKVNTSQHTYELIKDNPLFEFVKRGKIQVKGKGEIEMYFVTKAL